MKEGYYTEVKKTRHVEAVEEQGHYEGEEWIIDVPAVEEHDEEYWEMEFVEYQPGELEAIQLPMLKAYLQETDYVVIKINEAIIDGDEELVNQLKIKYADIIAQRKQTRERIQELDN